MAEPEIICERVGAAGRVILNRPGALNALTHGMVRALAAALDRWEVDPAVSRIVVTGAGGRAFCAGGDIRQLYEAGKAGDLAGPLGFWREEYHLNIRIKCYPKPYVALMDGIVMGGGVGVSLHGSHRVAGERYALAMPEVGIGFFPDVGATYALPRLPGEAGTYLALTGARVGAGDAVPLGLATHAAASGDLPAAEAALIEGAPVDEVLRAHARRPEPGPVTAGRGVIDRCFSGADVPSILHALDREAAEGSDLAREAAAAIRANAPSSLAIAFEQMRRGRALSFEAAMATEFRIVSRVIAGHDFYEGVRAAVVDKDRQPRWRPATLDALEPGFAARHFDPLAPADELDVGTA